MQFEFPNMPICVDIGEEIRANKQAILNVKVVLINQSVLHIKEYLDAKYRINRVS